MSEAMPPPSSGEDLKMSAAPRPPTISEEDLSICLTVLRRAFKSGLIEGDEAYPVSIVLEKIKVVLRESGKK